jgi:hypothetical protein
MFDNPDKIVEENVNARGYPGFVQLEDLVVEKSWTNLSPSFF